MSLISIMEMRIGAFSCAANVGNRLVLPNSFDLSQRESWIGARKGWLDPLAMVQNDVLAIAVAVSSEFHYRIRLGHGPGVPLPIGNIQTTMKFPFSMSTGERRRFRNRSSATPWSATVRGWRR